MCKCEFCGTEHDGSYGTGRFCSPTCARKFSNTFVSEDGRKNQIKALHENRGKGEHKIINRKPRVKKVYRNDLRPKYNHTLTLGKLGELDVAKKFIQHDYQVYIPLIDSGDGVDLVVYNENNGFKTVQVKSSTESKINNDGVCETTSFKVCHSVRHINQGTYTQTAERYSPDKVNYIALYSAYDDESYLIENSENLPMNLTVRNIKAHNSNQNGIRYSDDYQIDKVLDEMNLYPGIYYDEDIIDCENFRIN